MKLNEVYNKPIKEVVETMELLDMKVHTDDTGNVRAIELKYIEKQPDPQTKSNPWR